MKLFLLYFITGGALYVLLETVCRGRSHYSMFVAGGLAPALLCPIFASYEPPLWAECAAASAVITALEFTAGYIFNLRLKLGVWDYSKMPYNLYGQICPAFSLLWGIMAIPIDLLGKAVRGFV